MTCSYVLDLVSFDDRMEGIVWEQNWELISYLRHMEDVSDKLWLMINQISVLIIKKIILYCRIYVYLIPL